MWRGAGETGKEGGVESCGDCVWTGNRSLGVVLSFSLFSMTGLRVTLSQVVANWRCAAL